ncbi:MAG: hypothetical protein LBR75_05915 [Prevotellaceae bacterium]|jgi:5-methyltetrahydrofolate--homocysteine methyltransferase|nr:hypothetical protein [Prevotellaceae bacterium]
MPTAYTPFPPEKKGVNLIENIPLETVVPYINWRFFFLAWRISGNYEGIETVCACPACTKSWLRKQFANSRAKATEALSLYRDATAMLQQMRGENKLTINASVGIFPAISQNENIVFTAIDGKKITLPMLRQQENQNEGLYYSLADFISPTSDFAGVFALCVHGGDRMAEVYEKANDSYNAILAKTLSDRLAEATAEWLHEQVRKQYWGYAAAEKLTISEMLKGHYTGIRPAIGYPSLPDQSLIFELKPLLPFEKIGITLTENGAMKPNASICGLFVAHPKAKYFSVGKIDQKQLGDYAHRRGKNTDEMRKWLSHNID